ncbi:MAG: hypothetical protein JWM33_2696 [Caulobacteraceae bacterium]|nr:hypothetical protein [Caulobacteraceae bacterium]
MSLPERVLWRRLKLLHPGRFRKQHPVGPYILDFYCSGARLALEVDGEGHRLPDAVTHDRRRTAWLAGQGIQVLRFTALAILDDERLDGVLRMIAESIGPAPPP